MIFRLWMEDPLQRDLLNRFALECLVASAGHALARAAVQGPPEGLAREGAGVLAVVQQHLAIDQHIIYPYSDTCRTGAFNTRIYEHVKVVFSRRL